MALLKINNYTVSTTPGSGKTSTVSAGARGRSASNTFFVNQGGSLKRTWEFETTPLSMADAQGLIGMLEMRGEHFPYNCVDASGNGINLILGGGILADFASQKGLVPTANPTMGIDGVRGLDGSLVYMKGNILSTPYSALKQGSLHPSQAVANLLSVNEAKPTAEGHLTTVTSGTHVASTTRYWIGTGCVKVTAPGMGSGVRTSGYGAYGIGVDFVCSCYIKPAVGGEELQIVAHDAGGALAGSYNFTLPTNTDTWTRVWINATTAVGSPISFRILSNSLADLEFYLDALQLEEQNATPLQTFPALWHSGGNIKSITSLNYAPNFWYNNTEGFTWNAWIKPYNSTYTSGGMYIFAQNTTAANTVYCFLDSADNKFKWYLFDDDPARSTAGAFSVISTTVFTNTWSMITVTWEPDQQRLRLYVNGVLEATDTTNSGNRSVNYKSGSFDTSTSIGVSHRGTSLLLGATISHMSVLPYVASAALILGWWGTGAVTDDPLSFFPLRCSGDFLNDNETNILAFGQVDNIQTVEYNNSGSWVNNAVKIRFTLEEA